MSTSDSDYYAILGVAKGATLDQIKTQYKKLMRENHPDQYNGLKAKYEQNGDAILLRLIKEKILEAEKTCKFLNEAFAVLADPFKRKQYDDQIFEPPREEPRITVFPRCVSFGNLVEGQKKSSLFTIKNDGGPADSVNIDWGGEKPDWGDLIIEPDENDTFPIKVTVPINTVGIPFGPKSAKVVVTVDNNLVSEVRILLTIERKETLPSAYSAPSTSATIPITGSSTIASKSNGSLGSDLLSLVLWLILIGGICGLAAVLGTIVFGPPEPSGFLTWLWYGIFNKPFQP